MINRLKKMIQKNLARLMNCYPKYCLLCFRKTKHTYLMCEHCLLQLPYVKQSCVICGLKIMGKAGFCGQCLKKSNAFDRAVIPFYYKKPITTLLFQLKFQEKLASVSFFSYFLIEKIKQRTDPLPELIIPVPLHRKRMRTRGYNQALELAKQLSRALSIRCDRHLCKRIKPTLPQQGLKAKTRQQNVKHAFMVKKEVKYQHVAIVDDVMTTMATVNEISQCLKKQGISIIEVWCCARA